MSVLKIVNYIENISDRPLLWARNPLHFVDTYVGLLHTASHSFTDVPISIELNGFFFLHILLFLNFLGRILSALYNVDFAVFVLSKSQAIPQFSQWENFKCLFSLNRLFNDIKGFLLTECTGQNWSTLSAFS